MSPDKVLTQFLNFFYDSLQDYWILETFGYPGTAQNSFRDFDILACGNFGNNTAISWAGLGNEYYAIAEIANGNLDAWGMVQLVSQFPAMPVDYEYNSLDPSYIWEDFPSY